jgi:hypothetical protein
VESSQSERERVLRRRLESAEKQADFAASCAWCIQEAAKATGAGSEGAAIRALAKSAERVAFDAAGRLVRAKKDWRDFCKQTMR